MKKFSNRFLLPTGYALAFILVLGTTPAHTVSLPQDIEIDITTKKITSLLEAEKYIEALPYFEQLEAMKVPLPESFYYFKIKSLDKTTDTKKTITQAQSYFTNYGKNGKYYNEVLEIYSQVSMRNAKEEAVASELHVKKIEEELAQKKRIEDGWHTISSVWWAAPASNYIADCSAASSLIIKTHSSARNITNCNCTPLPSSYGVTSDANLVEINLGDFNHTARCLYSAPIKI